MKIKQFKHQQVTYEIIAKRRKMAQILVICRLTEEIACEYYKQAIKEWKEVKEKG